MSEKALEILAEWRKDYTPPATSSNGNGTVTDLFRFGSECYLPDEWWDADGQLGEVLRHVRTAALSEGKCPTALLTVVLCRVGAGLPYTIRLDSAGMGAPSPLSLFAFVVGGPGQGKSTTMSLGRRYTAKALPNLQPGVNDSLPLGSGEGFTDVLFDFVEIEGENGKKRTVKVQQYHNAYFTLDEGSQLQALAAGRSGSTLFQNICSVWSGGEAGNKNAGAETTRTLAADSYTYGLVVGVQPRKVESVVNDKDGGTPQRFLWTPAPRGFRLDERPAWPGPMPWRSPLPQDLRRIASLEEHGGDIGVLERYYITQDPSITAEMHEQENAVQEQTLALDEFDVHRTLMKRRVAGLLALLGNDVHITPELWERAEVYMATSDATRALVLHETEQERERTFAGRRAFQASIAAAQDEAVERQRTVSAATKIANKVHAEPERWLVSTMRRSLTKRDQDVWDDAIEHAVAMQWVRVIEEPGQGEKKKPLRPGPKKP